LIRIISSLYTIYSLTANASPAYYNGVEFYHSDEVQSPLFWSGKILVPGMLMRDTDTLEIILEHENGHLKHKHHYDQYFIYLCKVIFWCVPFIYLLAAELRLLHEYQVDAYVCKKYNKKKYGNLLIQFSSLSVLQLSSQAHGIFSHQLKNRLIM